KRAAVQDLVQRLNKARLWSLDHLTEYAMSTAELTKLPEDVLLQAYTAQRTSPIAIDENVIKEVQEASDRSTRYGILPRKLDVNKRGDVRLSGFRARIRRYDRLLSLCAGSLTAPSDTMAGGSVGSDPQNRDSATRSEQYQHGHHWNDEVLHRSFTRMSRPLT